MSREDRRHMARTLRDWAQRMAPGQMLPIVSEQLRLVLELRRIAQYLEDEQDALERFGIGCEEDS